jgi:hypothetical protein
MSSGYNVRQPSDLGRANQGSRAENWPGDMAQARQAGTEGAWIETTLRSVVESLEDYARENPLPFAAWAFGIGFILGWKLKPW